MNGLSARKLAVANAHGVPIRMMVLSAATAAAAERHAAAGGHGHPAAHDHAETRTRRAGADRGEVASIEERRDERRQLAHLIVGEQRLAPSARA